MNKELKRELEKNLAPFKCNRPWKQYDKKIVKKAREIMNRMEEIPYNWTCDDACNLSNELTELENNPDNYINTTCKGVAKVLQKFMVINLLVIILNVLDVILNIPFVMMMNSLTRVLIGQLLKNLFKSF